MTFMACAEKLPLHISDAGLTCTLHLADITTVSTLLTRGINWLSVWCTECFSPAEAIHTRWQGN